MSSQEPVQCGKLDTKAYMALGIATNMTLAKMTNEDVPEATLVSTIKNELAVTNSAAAIEQTLRQDNMIRPTVSTEKAVKLIDATMTTTDLTEDFTCCLDPLTGKWYPWNPEYGWSRGFTCQVEV